LLTWGDTRGLPIRYPARRG